MPPFTLRDVGVKALAAALSDLAAMGAEPAEAYVELGLPERFDDEALALADGIGAVAAREGVAVAGGDVTRSPVLFLAVTAVGSAADAAALVRRAGAREGDLVAITGELGGAAAGLELLERPELADGLERAIADRLRARQLEPRPLLAAGRALAEAGASSMIDVSDGVAADAGHLAEASGVAFALETASVPIQAGVAEVAEAVGRDVVELALGGGEDYELLVTLPAERIDEAAGALGALGGALTVIGAAGAGSGVELRDPGGRRREVPGFDQLEASRARPDRA